MDIKQSHTDVPPGSCFRHLAGYSLTSNMEDEVMLIDDLERLRFNESMELDFMALLFCTQGNIKLDINDEHYYVGTNDVLYCNRGTLLHHVSLAPGFRGKLLCVSWEYVQKLLMRGTCCWESILYTRQYPLLHLQPYEQQLLKAYYQLLAVKSFHYTPQNAADCIFLGFFQDFYQILTHSKQWNKQGKNYISCRKDELFRRFIVLLRENFREEHFLPFYADSLCVTPKYLGTVVKQASGQGAAEWIDACLMDEIRSLLCNSSLTVGEIAYRLHFSNPSFFGKFVKARTGECPQSLRKTLRAAETHIGIT